MSPFSLHEKLNGEGYKIELDKSKELFSKYEKEFEVGIKFLRSSGEVALSEGVLANMSGRRRYWLLPDPENKEKYPGGREDKTYLGRCGGIKREGGNFLIQSVNADMTKFAMILIRNYKKKHKIRTEFMNQVYDEIVTRTHKDDSAEFHKAKQAIMIESANKYLHVVPMEVDGHIESCWTK